MWNDNVYVAFSGGADSTVLLHLARMVKKDIPAVFVNTGLEFPEIIEFVKSVPNVTWLKPEMTFKQITETYGYPVISKETAQRIAEVRTTNSEYLKSIRMGNVEGRERNAIPKKYRYLLDAPFKISSKCCEILKHRPVAKYEKLTGAKAMLGVMADESSIRLQTMSKTGCFDISGKRQVLKPLSFWTAVDTHRCLNHLPHSTIYDKGYDRTGCMFCMFGIQFSSPNKFQLMKKTHPRLWEKALPAFGIDKVCKFMEVPYE